MMQQNGCISSHWFSLHRRQVLAHCLGAASAIATSKAFQRSSLSNYWVNIPDIPHPKFLFGQKVCMEWVNDDDRSPTCGTTYKDYGFIVGILFDHPDYSNRPKTWVYHVSWTKLESSPHIPLPYFEIAFEDELKAI